MKFKEEQLKPKTPRRTTMKSSTRDSAEGKLHKAKGKIKETVGGLIGNPNLRAEGEDENLSGRIQEKVGQVKKVTGN